MASFRLNIGYSYGSNDHIAQQEDERAMHRALPASESVNTEPCWEDLTIAQKNAFTASLIGDLGIPLAQANADTSPGVEAGSAAAAVIPLQIEPVNKSPPAVQKTAEAAEKSSASVLKTTKKKPEPKEKKAREKRKKQLLSVKKAAKVAGKKIARFRKHTKFSKPEEEYLVRVLTKPLGAVSKVVRVEKSIIRDSAGIKWSTLAWVHPKKFPKRKGKDLRDLWERRLNPSLKFGPFTEAENTRLRAMANDIEYKPKKGTAKFCAIARVLKRPDHMVRYQMIYLGLIEKVK
ncbi:MAG: hypothetical protein S4CHLAM37_01380 [Chlamydiia bacterium]|nr:hypothetical protein [Chlamydiia bacterium]